MASRFFWTYGKFCASHPWEVIVATLTLTACVATWDHQQPHAPPPPSPNKSPHRQCFDSLQEAERYAVDLILMSLIRCSAVLYSYHQFRHLQKFGSKYILGVAGLFAVFSCLVFVCTLIIFFRVNVSDLKDALFFFLLLLDLSKAALLAEFALAATNQDEVERSIARGMSLLGPTITLDATVETLVISVGTVSGVQRLQVLSCCACLAALLNYLVFMTFYPACLALTLQLSRTVHSKTADTFAEMKENPVVQRVKLIMCAGLVVVHSRNWWRHNEDSLQPVVLKTPFEDNGTIMKCITFNADNIVVLILLLTLILKYIVFDCKKPCFKGQTICPLNKNPKDFALCDKEVQTEPSRASPTSTEAATLKTKVPCRSLQECLAVYQANSRADDLSDEEVVLLVQNQTIASYEIEKTVSNPERGVRIRRKLLGLDALVDFPYKGYDYSKVMGVCCENVVGYAPVPVGVAGPRDKEVQTKPSRTPPTSTEAATSKTKAPCRSLQECLAVYQANSRADDLSDEEVVLLVQNQTIASYEIEKTVSNPERGVRIRRKLLGLDALVDVPYKGYDYSKVMGVCCENVVGYTPVPVGVAGPLLLDGQRLYIPMATTEGCLVASTNRGCHALLQCGVKSSVVADGMTRGPVVCFPSASRAAEALIWLEQGQNFKGIKESFDATSRYARLTKINCRIAGRHLFIRFVAKTGDAMGMNMLSKSTEASLTTLLHHFPDMELLSLSGNFCVDKKPAAVNWLEGRGKSVVCEAVVPESVVTSTLKTNVPKLVAVNIAKNLVGSAVAGSIGGFNAHAANVVTAVFIATGQDVAQNVTSSNCITLMEARGRDLYVSCTMPSVEVGTVGGGTGLAAQAACLEMLGVRGANEGSPGGNADKLARIVCGAVLAGELSLMAALASGDLVKSHMRHNRCK